MDWCRAHLVLDLQDDEKEVFVETGFSGNGLAMILRPSKAIFLLLTDQPSSEQN